jgi:protein-export membrane protein SecD
MKRRGRALWVSIAFVVALVGGSIAAFSTGTRPILGLDLEGGVSVILSAPEGTPTEVMDRALENIRNRIDAFGTAEPLLFVTGTTIEVQIPGLARGTIEEERRPRSCLLDPDDMSFGCFVERTDAEAQLEAASVEPVVASACLTGDVFAEGDSPCFGSEREADDAIEAMSVEKRDDRFCLTETGLVEEPCFGSRDRATAALDTLAVDVSQTFCLQGRGDETLRYDLGPACYSTEEAATGVLADLSVGDVSTRFCVVSSAGQQLGCFLSREDAEARLQETGQERLLQVIGQTARLEFREVIAEIPLGTSEFDATPVDCATPEERESADCSFEALRDREVVFEDPAARVKYQLGPVELTGDAIDSANAVFNSTGAVGQGWTIDFTLTSEGRGAFADATTRLSASKDQLAIVVDREVISAPSVDEPITGGSGIISGNFTENRAKDLATQLNAGALPVELTTEQVLTVSPTLGEESLQQGIVAGVAGLILLALYLLIYYRILAVVAWVGMTIWAILALALIAFAGRTFGYALTLAGVAGLVISLGVTADSYIVFFERFKDEVHGGKSPRTAVQPAFKKAFRTIIAADIVTALAAIVLYLTAISSVRGFALTLGVSVLLDLFVVYFFKRPAVFLLARSDRLVRMRWFGVRSGLAVEAEPTPELAGAAAR